MNSSCIIVTNSSEARLPHPSLNENDNSKQNIAASSDTGPSPPKYRKRRATKAKNVETKQN